MGRRWLARSLVLLMLLQVVLPAVPAGSGPGSLGTQPAERAPPIVILEDEGPLGFVTGHDPATGEPIYRPASGVTDGNGTAEAPYLIRDRNASRILIADTTAHVRLENVTVHGSQETARLTTSIDYYDYWTGISLEDRRTWPTGQRTGPAVMLYGVENATIAESTIRYDGTGLDLQTTQDIRLEHNAFLHQEPTVPRKIENVVYEDEQEELEDCHRVNGNQCYWWNAPGIGRAIRANHTEGLHLEANDIRFVETGLQLRHGQDVILQGNTFAENFPAYHRDRFDAIIAHDVQSMTLAGNDFEEATPHFWLFDIQDLHIVDQYLGWEHGHHNFIVDSEDVLLENVTMDKKLRVAGSHNITLRDSVADERVRVLDSSRVRVLDTRFTEGRNLLVQNVTDLGVRNVSFLGRAWGGNPGHLDLSGVAEATLEDVVLRLGDLRISDTRDTLVHGVELRRGDVVVDESLDILLDDSAVDEGDVVVRETRESTIRDVEVREGGLELIRSVDLEVDDVNLGIPGLDVEGSTDAHFEHNLTRLRAGGELVDYRLGIGDATIEVGHRQVFIVGAGNITATPHPTEPMEHGLTVLQAHDITVRDLQATDIHDPLEASGTGTLHVQDVAFTGAGGTMLEAEGFSHQALDNTTFSASSPAEGLWFLGQGSIDVSNLTLRDTGTGLTVDGAEVVHVRESLFDGVDASLQVVDARDVLLEHNRFVNMSAGRTVEIERTQGLEVRSNAFEMDGSGRQGRGLHLDHVGPIDIVENRFHGYDRAVHAVHAPGVLFEQNIVNHTEEGLHVRDVHSGQVTGDRTVRVVANTFRDVTDDGIYIGPNRGSDPAPVTILDNEFDEVGPDPGGIGIWIDRVAGADENAIHGNNFRDVDPAIGYYRGNGRLQAQDNWWGCPTGPSTLGCSTVNGNEGRVEVDPWRSSPNPEAGVSS